MESWEKSQGQERSKDTASILSLHTDTSHSPASALLWLQLASLVKPTAVSNVLPDTSIRHTPQSHPGETLRKVGLEEDCHHPADHRGLHLSESGQRVGCEVPGGICSMQEGLDGLSKENTFQVGEVLVLSVAWGTHGLGFWNPLRRFDLFGRDR